ncbi:MAG TPA: SusD/RagB family nutrient-binding outer membrane lipoprotein, partial [Sphingobacterium sp.]|nr:SusD/RagB family nutrient-binding outer membrane lipoprotein [Sphingobacterium sp.]
MIMNTFIKKFKYTPLLAVLLVTGCTKNFEKINTDPDALNDVPPQNMLVNVMRNA